MWKHVVQVAADGEQVNSTQESLDRGFRFLSADEKWIAQARPDGFTLSRVGGYENWASLRQRASALWSEYVRVAQPNHVRRVAVRYINRIELPLPVKELETYFNFFVTLPAQLPKAMAEMLIRTSVPFDQEQSLAIITLVGEPLKEGDVSAAFILDIDVFRSDVEWEPGSVNVWDCLDSQRNIKNQIFFSSLTDVALEAFK